MATALLSLALVAEAVLPPLADCRRFPQSPAEICDLLAFNRCYAARLQAVLEFDASLAAEARQALRETCQLYRAWDLLRDAKCGHYSEMIRRDALRQLRELIGPDAYAAGVMPPHVPLHRFERR